MNWIEIIALVFGSVLGGQWLINLITLKSQKKRVAAEAETPEIDNAVKLVALYENYAKLKSETDGQQIQVLTTQVTNLKTEITSLHTLVSKMEKSMNHLTRVLGKSKECKYVDDCPVQSELNKESKI